MWFKFIQDSRLSYASLLWLVVNRTRIVDNRARDKGLKHKFEYEGNNIIHIYIERIKAFNTIRHITVFVTKENDSGLQ